MIDTIATDTIATKTIATDNRTAVLGLGVTGISCVRYLQSRDRSVAAFDSGISEQGAADFQQQYPKIPLYAGEFDGASLQQYSTLLVSPGISLELPAIQQALASGSELRSDIDLLLAEVDQPVVAITGSNGKTTVTTLVGLMAKAAGLRTAVGGNIGIPVLDLLDPALVYDVFVLELSSFQLERSDALGAQAATVLNLSPDHLDRYHSLAAYQQSKQRIYRACRCAVYNRGDKLTSPLLNREQRSISFGLDRPDFNQYGLHRDNGETWLARGNQPLMSVADMKLHGEHNLLNALAALALGEAVGLELDAMLAVLRQFPGLPHRCQWLGECGGVQFYNDSKGTNTGATVAAVRGLSQQLRDTVLIAGGRGKGADFTSLRQVGDRLRGLVVLGEAAPLIAAALRDQVTAVGVDDMAGALDAALAMANPGDRILLSPACASFDMYSGYQQRGDVFSALVQQHIGGSGQ
jgi:UDP-N-acetylmuramoylalanine--D-glutamate ligase